MALTIKELSEYINRKGKLVTEGGKILVNVKCCDVRQQWGRIDVHLIPVEGAGVGNVWVSLERVQWES